MSEKARKLKGSRIVSPPGPSLVPRYREHNPYWSSSLFNYVYLQNDAPKKYAKIWDEDGPFDQFFIDFQTFVEEQTVEDPHTWSETDTISNWIIPIMRMLGWHDKCEGSQTPYIQELALTVPDGGKSKVYRLDLAYVDKPKYKEYTKKETKPGDRLREARNEEFGVQMVVEGKYWDRLEQHRQKLKEDVKRADANDDDDARSLSPDDQILKYLEILQRDFGILTDGKTWRLYHREHSRGDIRKHLEFDLGNLANLVRGGLDTDLRRQEFVTNAKYFYFLFRKSSFIQSGSEPPLAYQILEYSKKYVADVEEDLKKRFVYAMGFACSAIKQSMEKNSETVDLNLVRGTSESHLFNILFIRSCETRKILPLHAPDYLKHSLAEMIESMDHMRFDPEKDINDFERYYKIAFGEQFKLTGFEIYDRLMKLYEIVQMGDLGLKVPGFRESVFTKDELKVAKRNKIDNRSMLLLMFTLNFTDSEDVSTSRKYQQIPYNIFSPRQLGSIYESFLEYKLEIAPQDFVYSNKQWLLLSTYRKSKNERTIPDYLISRKGACIFTPNNEERKETGTYFTPDPVVKYLVQSTVPLIIEQNASSDVIASKRIIDPAMGSGHFLNATLIEMTNRYREAFARERRNIHEETFEHSASTLLKQCIFGVDLNGSAVKLAKMSLWMLTAEAGSTLVALGDHLKPGDSLDGTKFDWDKEFSANAGKKVAFDLIIGNPPYQYDSKNDSKWIDTRIRDYFQVDGEPLGERNPKGLRDDYVKFIRAAQAKIDSWGSGILAFITNQGYIDNATFRGMRFSLLKSFDKIFILNLNGNPTRGARSSKDQNVFPEIKQGVAIGIFSKDGSRTDIADLKYCDILGPREDSPITVNGQSTKVLGKYEWLIKSDIGNTPWVTPDPKSPHWLFSPTDEGFLEEYNKGISITDIFPYKSVGFYTARDSLAIHYSPEEATSTLMKFRSLGVEDARKSFDLGKDSRDWKVALAQNDLKRLRPFESFVKTVAYRPFDNRYTAYSGVGSGLICCPRPELNAAISLKGNIGIQVCRQITSENWSHVLATNLITDQCRISNRSRECGYVFPLYVPNEKGDKRVLNISKDKAARLLSIFGQTDSEMDIVGYVYGILFSSRYRKRYEEYLKRDFPKIPILADAKDARRLASMGRELLGLHTGSVKNSVGSFPVRGTNLVEKIRFEEHEGRIWINQKQFFSGIKAEVWSFTIGSYQVVKKWLDDRKGRCLQAGECKDFLRTIAVVEQTLDLIKQIDKIFERFEKKSA